MSTFQRATGCKWGEQYQPCPKCGRSGVEDTPCGRGVDEGVTLSFSINLTPKSLILLLITIGFIGMLIKTVSRYV